MRGKTLLIGVVGMVIGVLLSAAVVFAGSQNPGSGPGDVGRPERRRRLLDEYHPRRRPV
jgi:hypothetical protein